jgi:hypothetical protein
MLLHPLIRIGHGPPPSPVLRRISFYGGYTCVARKHMILKRLRVANVRSTPAGQLTLLILRTRAQESRWLAVPVGRVDGGPIKPGPPLLAANRFSRWQFERFLAVMG